MQVNRASVRKEVARENQAFPQEFEKGCSRAFVGVGESVRFFGADCADARASVGEFQVRRKRGVDINQVDVPANQRVFRERAQNRQIVA